MKKIILLLSLFIICSCKIDPYKSDKYHPLFKRGDIVCLKTGEFREINFLVKTAYIGNNDNIIYTLSYWQEGTYGQSHIDLFEFELISCHDTLSR